MGNEIAKRYDVDEKFSCTGGQNGTWKVYNAVAKATREEVGGSAADRARALSCCVVVAHGMLSRRSIGNRAVASALAHAS